jgi:biopolymer transport protein ExbB
MERYWKKITVFMAITSFIVFASTVIAAENWEQVASQINSAQDQAEEEAAETERMMKMDKADLEKELAELKAQEKREQRTLDRLRAEFESLRNQEEKLKQDLADEQDEIDAIEGTVRGTAKDASEVSRDNPITAENPERSDVLQAIIDSKRFPGMESIQTLADFFFQEMSKQGNVVLRTGEFVGPDGRNTIGEICRVGIFTTFYRTADGTVGFLLPDSVGKRLISISGDIPWSTRQQIKDYLNDKNNLAPIDPSAGGAFTKLTTKESFRDWLAKGGPLMYAIAAVGLFALLLALERFVTLATQSRASDKVISDIKGMVSKNRWNDAKNYCESKSRVPTCQMFKDVIEHAGEAQEVLENALQEAILKQMPRLERFLTTLSLLAAIAPLLGLLGTVTGMIQTFKVITEVGTGDPTMMAGGISVALLTTQFGLATAVPIMLVHHYLERQVDKIVNDMQEKGTSFAVTLIKRQGSISEA